VSTGASNPAVDLPGSPIAPPHLEQIYDAELDYVWHTLRRLGVADADLADICHEVFLIVHRRLGDYDPLRPIRPWLFGIAMRVAKDYRRSARYRRERLDPSPPEPIDQGGNARTRLLDQERRDLVARALATLDFDQRVVFVLHELEERTMPEIVDLVDAPLNTLYSRLRLARKAFSGAVRQLSAVKGEP
jgi:RNA polymerase sigma-70 factor, ECF subfamily